MKKIIKPLYLASFLVLGALLLSGCSQDEKNVVPDEAKINVMVSILPQVEFVERIGGDKVEVSEMIPPGFSPATYEPSPEQLQKLQTAEIYFRIGHIPFEKVQMEKLQQINPSMKVIDTSVGVNLLELAAHSHGEEEHGHEEEEHEEHEHEEEGDHEKSVDPHIWLSPNLVKIQAKHIFHALAEIKPEERDYFQSNYDQLIEDLENLDENLRTTFSKIEGKTILVFHPAFGYLASEYGFRQEAIEIEGKDPSPEHLKEIIDEAKADGVSVIFVQKQFSTKSAQAIAGEINRAVVQIDPLAKNYFSNLEEMSAIIVDRLQ